MSNKKLVLVGSPKTGFEKAAKAFAKSSYKASEDIKKFADAIASPYNALSEKKWTESEACKIGEELIESLSNQGVKGSNAGELMRKWFKNSSISDEEMDIRIKDMIKHFSVVGKDIRKKYIKAEKDYCKRMIKIGEESGRGFESIDVTLLRHWDSREEAEKEIFSETWDQNSNPLEDIQNGIKIMQEATFKGIAPIGSKENPLLVSRTFVGLYNEKFGTDFFKDIEVMFPMTSCDIYGAGCGVGKSNTSCHTVLDQLKPIFKSKNPEKPKCNPYTRKFNKKHWER